MKINELTISFILFNQDQRLIFGTIPTKYKANK